MPALSVLTAKLFPRSHRRERRTSSITVFQSHTMKSREELWATLTQLAWSASREAELPTWTPGPPAFASAGVLLLGPRRPSPLTVRLRNPELICEQGGIVDQKAWNQHMAALMESCSRGCNGKRSCGFYEFLGQKAVGVQDHNGCSQWVAKLKSRERWMLQVHHVYL